MRFSVPLLKEHYKLVVAGGGAAGNAISHYFSRTIPVSQIAIVDPMDKIYYQPGYAMIGANMVKDTNEVVSKRAEYHPKLVRWFRNEVQEFTPKKNTIMLDDGNEVEYDFLVVATGCKTRFDKIEGLTDALKSPGTCSIYTHDLAMKTRDEIQNFRGGSAIFTHPLGKIKSPGTPQQMCFLAEEAFRKKGVRDESTLMFNTALGELFGVERYRTTLEEVTKQKKILTNYNHNLSKVDAANRVAYFDVLDAQGNKTGETKDFQYELLHVSPPCLPIPAQLEAVKANDGLVDKEGWIAVDPKTLQNPHFQNVFGIGDCCNVPTAKTAAAASVQFRVIKHNLTNIMNGKEINDAYDGYSSSPLMTDAHHVVLAEYNYDGPLETTPLSQKKPSYLNYLLNRYLVPAIYWKLFLRGAWNGPKGTRKAMHLGFSR